jgi:hypothetical protein
VKHMFLAAAVAVLVCGVASAEIPQVLGYQGRITDNSGVPVADGTYAMRFRIYDDETAGTLLWDSNDDTVAVAAGAFSVMLGESPHPTLGLAFDEDYWLLVTFDGEDQTPRKRLGSVGYAYMASGVVPGTEVSWTSSYPTIKGTNNGAGAGLRGDSDQGIGVRGESGATNGKGVYGVANATTGNNYGVYGESGSTYGSGVHGTSTATSGSTYGGRFESNSSTYGRGVFGWAKGTAGEAVGVYGITSSPSGYAVRGEADATTGTNYGVYGRTNSTDGYGGYFDGRGYFSGKVGIGATTPGATLDVRGSAVFNEDGGANDFRIEGQNKPHLLYCDAVDDRVGIGTSSPGYVLDVIGSIKSSYVRVCDGSGNPSAIIYGSSREIATFGPNGVTNIWLGFNTGHPNYGYIQVHDDSGLAQAGMYVNDVGVGEIWAPLKLFKMDNPNQSGTEICYACIEGPEAAAYLRGTARLENGQASITFPDHFQAVATVEGMTVQLTPLSAECKGLAVTEKALEGIEVQELWNGTGSYDFDYLVMAVRKGFEDFQVIRPAMDRKLTEPPPAPGT